MINLGLHDLWSLIIGMAWINEQVWQNFCYILHRWKTANCVDFSSFVTWKTASRVENCSNLNKRTYSFIRNLRYIISSGLKMVALTSTCMDISADVGTQRQTLLINQGQSKGKLNLDIVLIELVTWYLIKPFGNVLEWIEKKKRIKWMKCIRCDQRFE